MEWLIGFSSFVSLSRVFFAFFLSFFLSSFLLGFLSFLPFLPPPALPLEREEGGGENFGLEKRFLGGR